MRLPSATTVSRFGASRASGKLPVIHMWKHPRAFGSLCVVWTLFSCGSENVSQQAATPPPSVPSLPPSTPNLCESRASKEAACNDGVDDDCDGLVDCADDDCGGATCGLHGLTCTAGACTLGGVFEPLPALNALRHEVRSDSAVFSFLPLEGAADYRIWELRDPSTIEVGADGRLVVPGAVYRCAGNRPLPEEWGEVSLGGHVLDYRRPEAESLLGYAYAVDGPGRVPVFALGDPAPDSDERTGTPFATSRVMNYTTSRELRDELLAAGHRDDGIVFYVPAEGDGPEVRHFVSDPQEWQQNRVYHLFYTSPAEHGVRSRQEGMVESSFRLLGQADEHALPVYRVTRVAHDVLALGAALRDRYLKQGNQPLSQLAWSGLTEETTLVLEALDEACPFEGLYAARATEAVGYAEPFLSLPDVLGTREVTINGQGAPGNEPKVIARSFVTVSPRKAPEMDFYADFQSSGIDQTYTETDRDNGAKRLRLTSELFDVDFYNIELPSWSLGNVLGQLWVGYADWAADTNGKFRMTPKQSAELRSDSFVHVVAEMDIPSTLRRYPQILISDRMAPVQDNLERGSTVIVQPFGATTEIQIQLCKQRTWDVNDQCPEYRLGRSTEFEPAYDDDETPWLPAPVPGEVSGHDLPVLFDVYASTSRVYVFMNGAPMGCADIERGTWEEGPVSVTLGDVLYHSGVDEDIVCGDCPHAYLKERRLTQALRRFDSFGFKSGVKAPAWNEVTMPCSRRLD